MPVMMNLSEDSFGELAGRLAAIGRGDLVQGGGAINVGEFIFVREPTRTMVEGVDDGPLGDAAKLGRWYKILGMVMFKLKKREVKILLGDVKVMMFEYKPSVPAIVCIEDQDSVTVKLMSQRQVEREVHRHRAVAVNPGEQPNA